MFRLLLLWAFTVFWDVSGIFADPVDVVVAKNKDFARIVFSWERPVAYDFRSNGRDVYIKFKRNIDASLQPILDKIPGYIEDVEVGKDGLGIKLKMRSDFDAYSYDSGSSVIIEIEGIPKKINSTTTLTKKKGNGSDNTQGNISEPDKVLGTVRSRFAEHSEYTRIVFDWVKAVPYKFEEKSGVVTVLFERSANVDISKLVKSPPRFIGEIKTRSNLNSSIVVLSVPPTSEVKHFVSGTKVVIDVGQPKNEAKIQKLPQGIFKEIDTLKTNKKKSSQILVFKQKRETLKTKQEASKIVKSVSKEKNSVISEKKETKGVVNASSSTLTLEKEKKGVVEKSSSNKIGKPASLSKRPKNESDLDADGKVKLASISMQKVEGANGGLAVKFNWKEPVAAAVFRRTGALWIAFDKKRRVDTNKLLGVLPVPEGVEAPPPPSDPENLPPPKPSLKDLVKSIEQITATGGTVLRLITNKGINPTLSRDGNSWILTFSRRQLKPNNPIEVRAEPNFPDGPRIFMPLAKSGSPLGVTDIETGYNMVIVPVIPLSHGVARGFVYPEVEVLETGQGAALIPSIDNLRVQSITKGIVLKSSVPINLSNVSGELLAATKKSIPGQLVTELELEQWSTLDGLDFQKRKEELQKFVAKAKNTKDIIEKNFDLARFYFSNGYGAEAIGVLKVIGSKQPEAIKNAEGLLLLAGSNYLMGRFSDSAIYLRNSKLDKIDEAAFWRAATVSKSGKMVAGAYEMQRTGDVIKTYPKPLQIPLSIFIAEAAVAIGQDKRAKDMIKSINKMEPNFKQKAEIGLIEGNLAVADGKQKKAVEKWETVLQIGDRPSYVKASAARINTLLRMERITPADSIRELEKLRFLWRGDEFEFNLLRRLGTLYLNQKGYRQGLESLRQAVTYFNEHKDVSAITEQMTDAFSFLYLNDGAVNLAPVSAIALFRDFQELTPAGRKGDEMIRKLADRLVSVDLLDQASELLNEQVRERLKGRERGEVGTNLVLIYAFSKKFKKMLEVLDTTKTADLPEKLVTRRRHLRAYALGQLNRRKEALILLKEDKSIDADLVRTEIFWTDQSWSDASDSLRTMLRSSKVKPGQKLTKEQAITVLNLATAYTLSDNERALMRLRRDFGTSMAKSSFADAFQLVAAPLSLGLISPGSVSNRVKVVTNFQSFMDKYKEEVESGKLSALTRVGKSFEEPVPISDEG